MPRLGHMMHHLNLVRRMGRAAGADLVAAQETGALTQSDWAAMVRACRGCGWAVDCPRWLDANPAVADAPPDCPNRAKLSALRHACPLSEDA